VKKKKSIGSSFEKFLKEEGTYEVTQAVAIKRVLTWQIAQAMKRQHLAKAELARRMRTSRSQLDRLLDPNNASITLTTLARAGQVLGKTIRLDLREA
jgi:antitoxin HicB